MKRQTDALQSPKLPGLTAALLAWLLVAGCAGRPLKGGRALTAPRPGGGLEQRQNQGDNPSQPSAQHQETVATWNVQQHRRLAALEAVNPAHPGEREGARRKG